MGSRTYDDSASSRARDAITGLSAARMALHRAMECLTDEQGAPIKRVPVTKRMRAQRNAIDAIERLTRFLHANGDAISIAQYARRTGAVSR